MYQVDMFKQDVRFNGLSKILSRHVEVDLITSSIDYKIHLANPFRSLPYLAPGANLTVVIHSSIDDEVQISNSIAFCGLYSIK